MQKYCSVREDQPRQPSGLAYNPNTVHAEIRYSLVAYRQLLNIDIVNRLNTPVGHLILHVTLTD